MFNNSLCFLVSSSITAANLSPAEKKQITVLRQSFSALQERLRNNDISADILQKITAFMECMVNRNFAGATVIQTDLVNTAWDAHKDWIKALKGLIQLASRK